MTRTLQRTFGKREIVASKVALRTQTLNPPCRIAAKRAQDQTADLHIETSGSVDRRAC